MKVIVTGAAGFIGFHLVKWLIERGDEVVGLDNINEYYSINLKYARLHQYGILKHIEDGDSLPYNELVISSLYQNYSFIKLNIEDRENLDMLFKIQKFDKVIHLAAQAGVRYSITNPMAYIESNIVGFMNILETCRYHNIKHLTYASSSSVYGLNDDQPYSTKGGTNHPISLYAATKKSNELMAHTYSHLYGLPTTGLRFFTVYGPWGRPDMALFLFTKNIIEGKPIDVYNYGNMQRDFTYIDDVIKGIILVHDNPAQENFTWDKEDPSTSSAPYKIYNIGNSHPVKLIDFIEAIEKKIGKNVEKNMLPLQGGDLVSTFADCNELINSLNYSPVTTVEEGIEHFVDWYVDFYKVNLGLINEN